LSTGKPTLTEVLKEQIRKSGLPLLRLSKETGVSTPQLSRFMRGKRSLSLPAAEALMSYFGIVAEVRRGKRP
jgi:antitoxin component HigA of HigAB toxin-antitoxin module